jgi:F-type H+-transporting ATPase subunit delta
VDAALIGGFIIRVGDKQLDASIASQIKQLKRDFSENEYVSEL